MNSLYFGYNLLSTVDIMEFQVKMGNVL